MCLCLFGYFSPTENTFSVGKKKRKNALGFFHASTDYSPGDSFYEIFSLDSRQFFIKKKKTSRKQIIIIQNRQQNRTIRKRSTANDNSVYYYFAIRVQ